MLIFKYRVELDFPSVRRFCLEVNGKINSFLVKKYAFTYLKSERGPEVELPFKLELVRQATRAFLAICFWFFFSTAHNI